jgi:hypothetical protein
MSYNTTLIWLNWTVDNNLDWCFYNLSGEVKNETICKIQNKFNDTSEIKNLTFSQPSSKLEWIEIPKNSTVMVAKLNVSGYKSIGEGWKNISSPTNKILYSADFYSDVLGFIVGSSGTILKWNGSWYNISSPTSITLRGVSIYNETLAFAVGDNGKIIKWDGTSWENDTSPLSTTLYSIDFGSGNLAFAGDTAGRIIKWNGTWYNETETVDPAADWDMDGISLVNSTYGFAVVGGYIYQWDGTSWFEFGSYTGVDFNDIEMYNETNGFTSGTATNDKEIMKWDGSTWTTVPTTGTDDLYGIDISDKYAYAVGVGGRIVKWNGVDWIEDWSPTSSNLFAVAIFGERAFAGGDGGILLENGGFPESPSIDVANSSIPFEWSY